ncbi:hypothetical protein P5G51_000375 [Virgibacillus sp. 179-BFC.A HS]|uniref:Uncharacterized protein n=1 Tax=Tigheibacillus jepli TaxID=3035914 RepID=A0ABU5CCS6_9BACI|nr:hypothetical protein [Virgibacillus sp. 179-BFC.A HS]MDY0404071.1 hypothetical protein [Virgibacillus sp. 179-BFC.A HS]
MVHYSFWRIQFLTYNFLEYQRQEWQHPGNTMTIGDLIRRICKDNIGQIVVYAYEQALAKKPLTDVLKYMKLDAA